MVDQDIKLFKQGACVVEQRREVMDEGMLRLSKTQPVINQGLLLVEQGTACD